MAIKTYILLGLLISTVLLYGCSPTKEKEVYAGEIIFSDYTWLVKTSDGKTGPGPNLFYYNESSNYVDSEGKLHLGIVYGEGKWYSSEVVLTKPLGYGTYRLVIENASSLDENLVLGFFTYDLSLVDVKTHNHREIDIEISRWGDVLAQNGQFTIQTPTIDKPAKRFDIESSDDLTALIEWRKDKVYLEIRDKQGIIESMTYSGSQVPVPGDERIRINFWLYNGNPPQEPVEVVVKEFSYIPNHINKFI